MQLAAWLDVALEGGVTELERARVEYRALRRLLTGDWRVRARRVAELAERLSLHRAQIDGAIDRARRRARMDEAASPALELAARVEREREQLEERLARVCGGRALTGVELEWLCDAATEEAQYERSLVRFRAERVAWTVAILSVLPPIPIASWLVASAAGTIGTVFAPEVLAEPRCLTMAAVTLAMLGISSARLSNWGWLGARMPGIFSPVLISGFVSMSAVAVLISFTLRDATPAAMALGALVAVGAPATLLGWWRARDIEVADTDVAKG